MRWLRNRWARLKDKAKKPGVVKRLAQKVVVVALKASFRKHEEGVDPWKR